MFRVLQFTEFALFALCHLREKKKLCSLTMLMLLMLMLMLMLMVTYIYVYIYIENGHLLQQVEQVTQLDGFLVPRVKSK